MRSILFLGVWGLASVVTPPVERYEYDVYVSTAFSTEQQEKVRTAMGLWMVEIPQLRLYETGDCLYGLHKLICVEPSTQFILTKKNNKVGAIGFSSDAKDHCLSEIAVDYSEREFVQIAEHEIGHCMGVRHVDSPYSVMAPMIQPGVLIPTRDDVRAWWQVPRW